MDTFFKNTKCKSDKDYNKLKLTIDTDKLYNKLNEYESKRKDSDWVAPFGILVSLITTYIFSTFKPILGLTVEQISLIYYFIIALCFIWLCYKLIKFFRGTNIDDFCDSFVRSSFDEIEYTAVCIVKHVGQDNIPKLLVYKMNTWGCLFLPYISYRKDIDIEKQIESLKNSVAGKLGVKSDYLNIEYLRDLDMQNIKENASKGKTNLFNYKFFFISVNSFTEREKFLNVSFESGMKKYMWKSVDELLSDAQTLLRNGDIIKHIESYAMLESMPDSLKNNNDLKLNLPFGNNNLGQVRSLKIIWNLTGLCPYKCEFCATGSISVDTKSGTSNEIIDKCIKDKKELTLDEKNRILLSISTVKDYIREIDFAGGDPILSLYDRKVIKNSKNIFPQEFISISCTGLSLKRLTDEEIKGIFGSYDLTYDYPYTFDNDHRDESYNYNNYEQAVRLKKLGININVQIPILPNNSSESVIRELVKHLNSLEPNSVTLMRYMPVGRLKYEEYPEAYNPDAFISIFKKILEETNSKIKYKLNCALRCKYYEKDNISHCNMLKEKIGIDKFGNAYSCPWAANLQIPKEKNPFYLGNLLDSDLIDILSSRKVITYNEKLREEKYCRLFSCINSNDYTEGSLFSNNDPLFKS